jgi:regulatory protein
LGDSLRGRALRLLARREHSRAELAAKLTAHAEEGEDIAALLDEFEERGWLSEARVVEAVLHARRNRFGTVRILHDLRAKGLSEESIKQAAAAARQTESQAAREVWRKKFGCLPANLTERARQARFLASRGFSAEVVKRVLDRAED